MEFYLAALWGIFPGNGFVPESIRPLLSEIWRSADGELTEVYRERLGTAADAADSAGSRTASSSDGPASVPWSAAYT